MEHTLDRELAIERLKQNKEPAIYVVDGCPPGKHTASSDESQTTAQLLAAVVMVACYVQGSARRCGKVTASLSAVPRRTCGADTTKEYGLCSSLYL